VALRLEGGEVVSAGAIVLNVPQGPMLQILRASSAPFSTAAPRPLYAPVTYPIMKLYVHYDDAWWRNYLNLTAGPFFNPEPADVDPQSSYMGVPPQAPAPLEGQYHDGDVRCDGPGGRCRGYLQAFYGNDKSANGGINGAIKFFSVFHSSVSNDSVVHLSPAVAEHRMLLEDVHQALVELHRPALDAAGVTERVLAAPPTGAVLSIWSQGVGGIHGGCHSPKPGRDPKPEDLPAAALAPFAGEWPVYVANEAYGHMHCWAEGSLGMARAAAQRMGLEAPADLATELSAQRAGPRLVPTDPFFLPGHHVARTVSAAGAVEATELLV